MSHSLRRRASGAALAVLTASALALTGCAGSGGDADTPGPITITVGGKPAATDEAGLKVFESKVEKFEAANPGITIEGSETTYDPTTFAAQVAGGTLPTVIGVPVTDIQSLISRGQVKDLSSFYESDDALKQLNPSVVANVKSPDGGYFGVPVSAFTLALIANRSVLTQAGIDPDTVSLKTWDDVAKVAKTVTDKTDAAGLAQLSTKNLGGWTLTAISAAMGGLVEKTADGTTEATVDNPATAKALKYLADLRWKNDALGSNFLLDFDAAGAAIASGQYGLMVGASEWYNQIVRKYGMAPTDFGLYPLPQASGGLGSLGGGTVAIVRADATDAEATAAVKWTEFFYLNKFVDLDFAAEEAAASAKDGAPVPRVGLPVVDEKKYNEYLAAIDSSINVPLDNLEVYYSATRSPDFTVVTEPAVEAQQIYALLDTVLQAVLTDQNANVSTLLADAQKQAETIVNDAQAK